MTSPMFILPLPLPSGSWDIWQSLLYLAGVVGAFAYVEFSNKPKDSKPARHLDAEKEEAFTRALIEAADERWSRK